MPKIRIFDEQRSLGVGTTGRIDPRAAAAPGEAKAQFGRDVAKAGSALTQFAVEKKLTEQRTLASSIATDTDIDVRQQLAELRKKGLNSDELAAQSQKIIDKSIAAAQKRGATLGSASAAFLQAQLNAVKGRAATSMSNIARKQFVAEQGAEFERNISKREELAINADLFSIFEGDDSDELLAYKQAIEADIQAATGTVLDEKQAELRRQKSAKRIRIGRLKRAAATDPEGVIDALAHNPPAGITPEETIQITQFAEAQRRKIDVAEGKVEDAREQAAKKASKDLQDQLAEKLVVTGSISEDLQDPAQLRILGIDGLKSVLALQKSLDKTTQVARSNPDSVLGLNAQVEDPDMTVDEVRANILRLGESGQLSPADHGSLLGRVEQRRRREQTEQRTLRKDRIAEARRVIKSTLVEGGPLAETVKLQPLLQDAALSEYDALVKQFPNEDPYTLKDRVIFTHLKPIIEQQDFDAAQLKQRLGITTGMDVVRRWREGRITEERANFLLQFIGFLSDRQAILDGNKVPKKKLEDQTTAPGFWNRLNDLFGSKPGDRAATSLKGR